MSLLDRPLFAKPKYDLTPEQRAIVDCPIQPGQLAKIVAYAGTGKTSTFVAFAAERPSVDFTYLAFNKSVEVEAKARFGSNTMPKTVHALAYNIVGRRYSDIVGSIQTWQVAKQVRCPLYEATIVVKTIESFLNSADHEIDVVHVEPDHLGRLSENYHEGIVQAARSVWQAVINQTHGFKMTHSGYLKLYQLSMPEVRGDMIFLDEAQDTNPVTQAIVMHQLDLGKAVLMCGDPYQQIYAWRGAIDAMQQTEAQYTYRLTQSFRFGENISNVANHILSTFFGETVPLVGLRPGDDCEENPPPVWTTITRTNAEIFARVADLASRGDNFHVIGREAFYQLLDQLTDVFFLYAGKRDRIMDRRIGRHNTFEDLKEFAQSTLDNELIGRCIIVDKYKDALPPTVSKIRELYVREPSEMLPIFVTTHKAKGLEWRYTQLSNDFASIYDDQTGLLKEVGTAEDQISKDDINLLYVAVTRAKQSVRLNRDLQRLIARFPQQNENA